MYLALYSYFFSVKADRFVLYFVKDTFLSKFATCFYDRNTFLVICGKCKIISVSKISIWLCRKNKKNKKQTRASLFQYSADGKREVFYLALHFCVIFHFLFQTMMIQMMIYFAQPKGSLVSFLFFGRVWNTHNARRQIPLEDTNGVPLSTHGMVKWESGGNVANRKTAVRHF